MTKRVWRLPPYSVVCGLSRQRRIRQVSTCQSDLGTNGSTQNSGSIKVQSAGYIADVQPRILFQASSPTWPSFCFIKLQFKGAGAGVFFGLTTTSPSAVQYSCIAVATIPATGGCLQAHIYFRCYSSLFCIHTRCL